MNKFLLSLLFLVSGLGSSQALAIDMKNQILDDSNYKETLRMEVVGAGGLTEIGSKKFALDTGRPNFITDPNLQKEDSLPGWVYLTTPFIEGYGFEWTTDNLYVGQKRTPTHNVPPSGSGGPGATILLEQDIFIPYNLKGKQIQFKINVLTGLDAAATAQFCIDKGDPLTRVVCKDLDDDSDGGYKEYNYEYYGEDNQSYSISIVATLPAGTYKTPSFAYGFAEISTAKDLTITLPPQEYTALISDTGAISDQQPENWISNVSLTDTSLYTATYVSSKFSSTMNCGADAVHSSGNRNATVTSKTLTGFVVRTGVTRETGGVFNAASSFKISCTPTGSDSQKSAVPVSNLDYGPRPYTPSSFEGLGSPTSVSCTEARQGYLNIIECSMVLGTTTSATVGVAMPYGRTISGPNINRPCGDAIRDATSSVVFGFRPICIGGLSILRFSIQSTTLAPTALVIGTNVGNSGMTVRFRAEVPIDGWDSSAQGVMVYLDQVFVEAVNSSAQTISSTTHTTRTNWTEIEDTHNFFNPVTGVFSPTKGRWICSLTHSALYGPLDTNTSIGMILGSSRKITTCASQSASVNTGCLFTNSFKISAGETVSTSLRQDSGSSKTLNSSTEYNYLSISCMPY